MTGQKERKKRNGGSNFSLFLKTLTKLSPEVNKEKEQKTTKETKRKRNVKQGKK